MFHDDIFNLMQLRIKNWNKSILDSIVLYMYIFIRKPLQNFICSLKNCICVHQNILHILINELELWRSLALYKIVHLHVAETAITALENNLDMLSKSRRFYSFYFTYWKWTVILILCNFIDSTRHYRHMHRHTYI